MVMPISLRINDNVSFDGNFLVDIGSSGSISLNSSLVAKLKLSRVLTDVKKKIYDTGGVGGSRTDYLFVAKDISVAGYEIEDVVTDFSGNTQGMMANDSFDGLVGNAFFERFDVIFDFAKCEIWLRPNRNFNIARQVDSGITLTGGGALLRGIDKLIADATGMPVHIAENPLDCVVTGTAICLEKDNLNIGRRLK